MKKTTQNVLGRTILPVIYRVISVFLILATVYFGSHYVIKNFSLNFTSEDMYILVLFAGATILASLSLIRLSLRVSKLERAIEEIVEDVSEAEDNNIKFSRVTQELILELFSRFEVDSCEKKS